MFVLDVPFQASAYLIHTFDFNSTFILHDLQWKWTFKFIFKRRLEISHAIVLTSKMSVGKWHFSLSTFNLFPNNKFIVDIFQILGKHNVENHWNVSALVSLMLNVLCYVLYCMLNFSTNPMLFDII